MLDIPQVTERGPLVAGGGHGIAHRGIHGAPAALRSHAERNYDCHYLALRRFWRGEFLLSYAMGACQHAACLNLSRSRGKLAPYDF